MVSRNKVLLNTGLLISNIEDTDILLDQDLKEKAVIMEEPYPLSQVVIMPEWVQATVIAANILIFIFGFCGNIAAIIVVLKSKLAKHSTKLFLVHLAISDFLLVICAIPVDLAYVLNTYHSWILGETICHTISLFQTQAFMMNALCLFAIALERYLSVIRSVNGPILNRKWNTRLSIVTIALAIWIIPTGLSVPQLWAYELWSFKILDDLNNGSHVILNDTAYNLCIQRPEFKGKANAIFYCTLGCIFFAILIAFLFCYLSIVRFVKNHRENFQRTHCQPDISTIDHLTSSTTGTSVTKPARIKGRHHRTVTVIMSLLVVFTVCHTPNWIFLIVLNTHDIPATELLISLMYFLHVLSHINSALSPFLYTIWNDSLRVQSGDQNRNTNNTTGKPRGIYWLYSIILKQCGKGEENESFGMYIKRGKENKYYITSQSRTMQSYISTQKILMSEKNPIPCQSIALQLIDN